jgi:putative membrane protein
MVIYNPKDWFKLIFAFHKSDTFRMLIPALFTIAIVCFGIVYIEIEVWNMKYKSTIAMHSLLGFVISLLLVFRTNTAYDRWWEGRKMWGAFVNHSRSLATKIEVAVDVSLKTERAKMNALLCNYFIAAKDHLRGVRSSKEWKVVSGLDNDTIVMADHVPNRIIVELSREIESLRKAGKISDMQWLSMQDELRMYSESLGACERIRSTPIPYSYSLFIKKIIFLYTLTMPFGFVTDFGYWTILVTTFIFYAFASLELIAEEIEDPFGTDANDLPTDELAGKIGKQIDDILKV